MDKKRGWMDPSDHKIEKNVEDINDSDQQEINPTTNKLVQQPRYKN